MKLLVSLLFFILNTQLLLASVVEDVFQKKIRAAQFQAEGTLKKEILSLIKTKTKSNKVDIDLQIEVDSKAIYQAKGFAGLSGVNNISVLPGLDFDQSIIVEKINSLEVNSTDVMKSISAINVMIKTVSEISDEAKEVLSTTVKHFLKTLAIPSTNVQFELDKKVVFFSDESPNKIFEESGDNASSISSIFMIVISVILLLVLGVVMFMISSMRKTAVILSGELKTAIEQIDTMGGSPAPVSGMGGDYSQHSNKYSQNQSNDGNAYEKVITKIKGVMNNNMTLIPKISDMIIKNKNHELFVVFNDCLDEDQRNDLSSKAGREFISEYKTYLLANSSKFLNPESLVESAQKLFNLFWLGAQNPDSIEQVALIADIKMLSKEKLKILMDNLSDREMSAMLNYIDPKEMASLFSEDESSFSRFEKLDVSVKFDKDMQEQLKQKMMLLDSQDKSATSNYETISSFLPYELEGKFNKLIGKDGTAFDNLTNGQKEKIYEFLAALDMNSLRSAIAALPRGIVDEFIKTLPDIKANRILSKEIFANEQTFILKNKIVDLIKDMREN
jgi:hypothetical protein